MDTKYEVLGYIENILTDLKIPRREKAIFKIGEVLTMYSIAKPELVCNDTATRIQHFISAKRVDGLSEKTLKAYSQQLYAFNRMVNKPTDVVKTDDIRNYVAYLYNNNLKNTSVSTIVNTLKSFYSWLYSEELIKKNPMLRIKPIRIDKKRLRSALTLEDIERVRVNCVKARDKAMFELFYSSGCRLSELVSLNISDINMLERSMVVTGKGNKKRIIYFSVKAKMCLQDYLRGRKGNSGAVFVSLISPYERLEGRIIQKNIKRLGVISGIQDLHPHKLRHTFASHALHCGMSLTAIQQFMGHEDINTTQIYAKISISIIKQEYSKLVF